MALCDICRGGEGQALLPVKDKHICGPCFSEVHAYLETMLKKGLEKALGR